MSLATRCSACGTVFRVVQDQLKVSEGWVRCGRCHEVFNALEALFDLERDALALPPAPEPSEAAPPAAPAPSAADAEGPPTAQLESRMSTQFDSSTHVDSGSASGDEESAQDSEADENDTDFADARFNLELIDADEAAALAAEAQANDEAPQPAAAVEASAEPADAPVAPEPLEVAADAAADPAPAHEAGPPAVPDFLQAGAATPRSRGTRIALRSTAVLLLAALVLQGALHFHDALAARWPLLGAPLAALCAVADCTLDAPRALDAVSVDGSGLTRTTDAEDVYRFSLVLRNRADFAVATPSVELSLTDAGGQLVSRRVLRPADFGGTAVAGLPAGGETPLQLLLASSARLSGYTVELFYP